MLQGSGLFNKFSCLLDFLQLAQVLVEEGKFLSQLPYSYQDEKHIPLPERGREGENEGGGGEERVRGGMKAE